MNNRKSSVWEFYNLCEDKKFVKCKICDIQISRGGIGKKATTTPLINHLRRNHGEDYTEYEREKDVRLSASLNTCEDNTPKQQTLQTFIEKSKKWDLNDKRAKEIHVLIGEMIVLDNLPVSSVQYTGFKRLLNHIVPNYVPPSRNYFSEKVIPEIHNRVVQTIKKKITLESAKFLSFTTDVWTCSSTNESFISLTGHWITENFQHNNIVLNCKHFPGSHNSEAIKDMMSEMLNTWDLDTSRIHLVVRDNAANITKGCDIAGFESVSCFIHTIQLVVMEGIKSQRSISDLIAVSRKIVGHFSHSPKACSALKNIQAELNLPTKKLVQDVQTRWNSTFYMLQRIREQKRALNIYIADNNLDSLSLTANQWALIEPLINLLEPFEEITRLMSLEIALISEVIPTITALNKFLASDEKPPNQIFAGVGTMKDFLYKEMSRRFDNFYKNKYYVVSTILDPRFKLAFFEKNKIEELKIMVINEKNIETGTERFSNDKCDSSDGDDDVVLAKLMKLNPEQTVNKKKNIWDCFDEIAGASTSSVSEKNTKKQQIEEELKTYLDMSLLNRKENPLIWWNNKKFAFPILSGMARKFLSAPASSVYSERLFSEMGTIYEETRNRLLPRNAETLLFLHHNLQKLNFEY